MGMSYAAESERIAFYLSRHEVRSPPPMVTEIKRAPLFGFTGSLDQSR